VVIGRLGRSALRSEDDISVEEAMTEGPGTIRPSARLQWAIERMDRRNLTSLPVTTSEGRLVGLLLREDAEAAASPPVDRR
jgi:CBS domain-containing protein